MLTLIGLFTPDFDDISGIRMTCQMLGAEGRRGGGAEGRRGRDQGAEARSVEWESSAEGRRVKGAEGRRGGRAKGKETKVNLELRKLI